MKPENINKEPLFFCRNGMFRHGPYTGRTLRKFLQAGVIDAQTLIREDGSCAALPLGSSNAAREITAVAVHWRWQYSPLLYCCWMIFVPLFSAGVAGIGLSNIDRALAMLPIALILGMLGMSLWLLQTWQILLADERPKAWKPALYALPMALLGVNLVWIWIGYMKLPKYWRKFKQRHKVRDNSHYWLYYLVMVLFYMISLGTLSLFFLDFQYRGMVFGLVSVVSWLWFGMTLLSLFVTDTITTQIIKNKLSILAFGAVRFCADINYDKLHKAVLTLALRARKGMIIFSGTLLVISWLLGGWIWINAVEVCRMQFEAKLKTSDALVDL